MNPAAAALLHVYARAGRPRWGGAIGSLPSMRKVPGLYDQLGIGDQIAISCFNGGHTIIGVGTFDLLQTHLDWPKAEQPRRQPLGRRHGRSLWR